MIQINENRVIEQYISDYCPNCRTLPYPYEEVGLVCGCKSPWEFVTMIDDSYETDEVRQHWIQVQVTVELTKV
jgi:hypothetical protein